MLLFSLRCRTTPTRALRFVIFSESSSLFHFQSPTNQTHLFSRRIGASIRLREKKLLSSRRRMSPTCNWAAVYSSIASLVCIIKSKYLHHIISNSFNMFHQDFHRAGRHCDSEPRSFFFLVPSVADVSRLCSFPSQSVSASRWSQVSRFRSSQVLGW